MWDFMVENRSAQGPVPKMRFNMKGFHHADEKRAGVMAADGGYFIQEDVRQFEPGFFGLNNFEAKYMDPQQRQLLEVTYECLENAAVSLESASGSNTGVFVGNFTLDYQTMQTRDPEYGSRYTATGTGTAIMANRISHVFNLHGPSYTIDTACSSSIYCLHNAVQAIKNDECDRAIVAAANLITSPEQHLGTMKGGVLSPTSTCHTFDISADGYGRGEAVNAVYLKRLSAALTDGDHVWAVIRGSAINANGNTPGISQPSATLQEAVIRKAYDNAKIDFDDTDYVECHGTGTAVGDPIEVDALAACFIPRRHGDLKLGSVKANFGHSEAASGLTSIIKVSLSFMNGCIPPTHGITRLNPRLKFDRRPFKVVTVTDPWPREIRRASINSFGFGGANGHVVLESISSYLKRPAEIARVNIESATRPIVVLPLSTASSVSLQTHSRQMIDLLQRITLSDSVRAAYTMGAKRSQLGVRAYILKDGESCDLLGEDGECTVEGPTAIHTPRLPIGFVFSGQGSQYIGMAKELFDTEPVFIATISALDRVLETLPLSHRPHWKIQQVLQSPGGADGDVNDASRSQPLCTAIQIGLIDVLRSWSIDPAVAIGHSSGEIAAAYTCGNISAENAILISYLRGYSVAQCRQTGAMMAVGISPEEADAIIAANCIQNEVCVACDNAPNSVTISGPREDMNLVAKHLLSIKPGVFARKLDTGERAYHSPMMREVADLYESLLSLYVDEVPASGSKDVKMYSTASRSGCGLQVFDGTNPIPISYWRENLEKPVQFYSGLKSLASTGKFHLIEIGPHSALRGYVKQIRASMGLDTKSLPYTPTLLRNRDASRQVKSLAGQLFVHGHQLNWLNVIHGSVQHKLLPYCDLPPYPWDHSGPLLWHEPRASVELRNRTHVRHELLGSPQVANDGINRSWRNILRLSEMPWLRGHRVDNQVVFPAAGYLATAIEALSQILNLAQAPNGDMGKFSFDFRNMNIRSALVIAEEDEMNTSKREFHTTMAPRKLSTAATSSIWYDFNIYSWVNDVTTLHCAGSIRIADIDRGFQGTAQVPRREMRAWAPEPWYEMASKHGLCFEDDFKSLLSLGTEVSRARPECICTANIIPQAALHANAMHYPMHPITIDACLQAAIMGSTAGNLEDLRGYLPVFISKAQIRPARVSDPSNSNEASIHTQARKTSFASMEIDSTLRDPRGDVLVDLVGVKMVMYTSKRVGNNTAVDHGRLRYPCLRARWKPDIQRLHWGIREHVEEYVTRMRNQDLFKQIGSDAFSAVGVLLDLAGHKNPSMRVLLIGDDVSDQITAKFQAILDVDTPFRRFSTWHIAQLDETRTLELSDPNKSKYDVVVLMDGLTTEYQLQISDKIGHILTKPGILIAPSLAKLVDSEDFPLEGYRTIHIRDQVLLALRSSQPRTLEGLDILILVTESSKLVLETIRELSTRIKEYLKPNSIQQLSLLDLCQSSIRETTICISFLELTDPFLPTMSSEDMSLFKYLTSSVKELLWVIGADMLGSPVPDLTLSHGLARAFMLEQPTMKWSIVDVGRADAYSIAESLINALPLSRRSDDKEIIYSKNLPYINRFSPDVTLNTLFSRRFSSNPSRLQQEPLGEIPLAKLIIDHAGGLDTLHLQNLDEIREPLPTGYLDIAVQAVSLNAKDVYVMSSRAETRGATTTNDFSGIVTAVGQDVRGLVPGDRVVVMAPTHFKTVERVPSWAVYKMCSGESFTEMASLPIVYATALYALHDRARLRQGESVLIHSGAGALGLALINVARRIGAHIYTTVGSETKRRYLMDEIGIPGSDIFSSRTPAFAEKILRLRDGRGVDVVINSLVGELMHASWECIGSFGRFVEVGKRELLDAGQLSMEVFLRNATFSAFDISEMFYQEEPFYRDEWSRKLSDVVEMYRRKEIIPGPVTVYDIKDVTQAYRHFSNPDRLGKIVVSLEDTSSSCPVAPAKYLTVFDADKVYLLIGCLGGLGRSLSRWMFARGARRLCFLSRSGLKNPAAKAFVEQLQGDGAAVKVVIGDASIDTDVSAAVNACEDMGGPIGGAIQAAMGLSESLFSNMSLEAWQTAVKPKCAGTWNLHNALLGHDEAMDFFLLTSSMSGSIGTATETNYCAANGFLDAFAAWRQAQGKPAISVGLGMISEVGYLHENPQIEELLLRRGIQPLNEQEFLQVIDLALSGAGNRTPDLEKGRYLTDSLILTGLEHHGFLKLMEKGYAVNFEVAEDPRLALLSSAVKIEKESLDSHDAHTIESDLTQLIASSPWLQPLPVGIARTLAAAAGATSLSGAVKALMTQRFSSLILMPVANLNWEKSLAKFGVDSMIAAEFRAWLWNTFEVDVPFLDLLSPQMSLATVADTVIRGLESTLGS
ncbi:polyketide synthase [Xylariaceae sp. FL0016]|nr:polyketide synthase [Xylariaceae sp. FL0016]